MSRWKPLPAELDPRVRQLVVRLRRLKDHSGLNVRQLAARTEYSPKSWERYFGARALPPVPAVAALARVCGEDPTRLLALREVAAEAWPTAVPDADPDTGPDADANPEQEPEPDTEPDIVLSKRPPLSPERRVLRIALVAGSVTLVLVVVSAVLVTVRLMDGRDAGTGRSSTAPLATPASASPSPYSCRVERVGGHWYAGNSRTQQENLAVGSNGPDVAEAQCLLRRAGISPGGIDGMFGPLTEHAVKQFQERAGLDADGMVGPHTWKALRA
ncbi:peptidoglycan-binding protein [Streptomyces sp. NPDC091280]|uniref:peptidoglycan-binding protein n=1 Tax=Streptomyces sp. NPDC091280 TaxID=3365984 RepID=UPI00380A2296